MTSVQLTSGLTKLHLRTDLPLIQTFTNNSSKSCKPISANPSQFKTFTAKLPGSSTAPLTSLKTSSNFCQSLLRRRKLLRTLVVKPKKASYFPTYGTILHTTVQSCRARPRWARLTRLAEICRRSATSHQLPSAKRPVASAKTVRAPSAALLMPMLAPPAARVAATAVNLRSASNRPTSHPQRAQTHHHSHQPSSRHCLSHSPPSPLQPPLTRRFSSSSAPRS
jgi:hypothetical protein